MVDTWFGTNYRGLGQRDVCIEKGGKRMYDYACVNKWTM
jgi:hypothetical protein